jgi:hypothetical protein
MLYAMSATWQGFLLILGVGLVVLLVAALADRRTRRRGEGLSRDMALTRDTTPTPGSGQPGADTATQGGPPQYLTTTELLRRSNSAPVDAAAQAVLRDATSIALTLVSPDLATHDNHRSLATDPAVLVCADPVTTLRELLPVLAQLSPDKALTIAAPVFDDTVIDALAANVRAGTRFVQAVVGEAGARAELAGLTGAVPVARPDLQAGAVSVTALGHAKLISASRDATRVAV